MDEVGAYCWRVAPPPSLHSKSRGEIKLTIMTNKTHRQTINHNLTLCTIRKTFLTAADRRLACFHKCTNTAVSTWFTQTVPHRQLPSSAAGPVSPCYYKMHPQPIALSVSITVPLSYRVVDLQRVSHSGKYRASFGFHLESEELTVNTVAFIWQMFLLCYELLLLLQYGCVTHVSHSPGSPPAARRLHFLVPVRVYK